MTTPPQSPFDELRAQIKRDPEKEREFAIRNLKAARRSLKVATSHLRTSERNQDLKAMITFQMYNVQALIESIKEDLI